MIGGQPCQARRRGQPELARARCGLDPHGRVTSRLGHAEVAPEGLRSWEILARPGQSAPPLDRIGKSYCRPLCSPRVSDLRNYMALSAATSLQGDTCGTRWQRVDAPEAWRESREWFGVR